MTPSGIRPLPSIFPHRLEESPPNLRQRYIVSRILEGNRRLLSGPEQDGFSVAQRLARLDPADRETLAQETGNAYNALSILAEEPAPQDFYEGLLRVGRRAEDEDRFELAQRCYHFLASENGAGLTAPDGLRHRAEERLAVLGGGGSRWDRFEFAMTRVPRQLFDPTFLVGMGAASLAARGLRLGLLARSWTASSRIVPRLLEAGALATGESLAFVAAERGTAALLGRPDYSASAGEEWLRYGLPMFLGGRVFGTAAGQIYRRGRFRQAWLTNGSLEGARIHRLGYGIATQGSLFTSAYLLQNLENRQAASERRPHDAVAQALLWMATFSVFGSTARRITGSRALAWERSLFRPR